MSAGVILRPGRMPIADWRAIHAGAAIALDPVARIDVEAGRAAIAAIRSHNGAPAPSESGGSPSVADLIEGRGAPLPEGHIRLFVALKLAALAQGAAGVSWELVETLAGLLADSSLPAIPAAADDRTALAGLFGAVAGIGEVVQGGDRRPAMEALRAADRQPAALDPRERGALLSGTELSLATALVRLFTAERILQAAIVASALSDHTRGGAATFPLAVHRLHRQRGQMEIATALHALPRRGESDGGSPPAGSSAPPDADKTLAFRMGAALDLLRQAAGLLERAANGASEGELVLWQTEELVDGIDDLTSVALASDLIAASLATLGEVAAERIAAAAPPSEMIETTAARATKLAAANRERAGALTFDPAAMPRLHLMLETTAEIVAIEYLQAATDTDAESGHLPNVLAAIRAVAPKMHSGAVSDEEIDAVAALVRSGALGAAAGVPLPSASPSPTPQPPDSRPKRR